MPSGGGGSVGVADIVTEGVGQQKTAELYVTVGGDENTDLAHGHAWDRPGPQNPRKQNPGSRVEDKYQARMGICERLLNVNCK